MPVPNKGESQKKFVSRCIPIVINEGTTKDSKQAAAICFSLYKKHKSKKSRAQEILDGMLENYRNNKKTK